MNVKAIFDVAKTYRKTSPMMLLKSAPTASLLADFSSRSLQSTVVSFCSFAQFW
jgi:hypothetical protein